MKLVEKKCPNCGASLEFSDTDKSCKCNYCHRAFEIERDLDKGAIGDYAQQFILSEMNATLKIYPIVIGIIIFIVALFILGIIFFGFQSTHKTNNFFEKTKKVNTIKYFKDASELSNEQLSEIDFIANMKISAAGNGENNVYHSYQMDGAPKMVKLYVLYKDNKNYVVAIYQAIYHDFFHQENKYTVFVPLVYKDVSTSSLNNFQNPEISASEYYFNDEKTSYTFGYASLDDTYNNVVKPYANTGFKVSEK